MFSFLKWLFSRKSSRVPIPPKFRSRRMTINHSSSNYGYIAHKWELIMGQNHWETLLNPLDIDLRRIIIQYGEISQATYDTFVRDQYSKHGGASRFNKNNFFAKLGLELGHPYKYRVTKFIYATSGVEVPHAFIFKPFSMEAWSKESNFIGFIAVAEDKSVELLGRREIVVAWRGSVQFQEWVNNFQFFQVSASSILGQEDEEEENKGEVLTELTNLVEQYKNEEISITLTGHSLGGALATMNAVDIVANKINLPKNSPKAKPCMVTAIVFASPRVGDANFKNSISKYDNLRILRVRNAHDMIPNHPTIDYYDIGDELLIDTTQSAYLKNPWLPSVAHNLEVYMHGVAGTHGSEGEFKLAVDRDIALLNKNFDLLKDDYLVPANWWVQKCKGMVQQVNGSWVLMDHEIEDDED
ncbi:Phospholipase A1-IIgamma [Bienertia sinuspersici]